jgi:hypothetical protein
MLQSEQVVTFAEATKLLPAVNGKRVHPSSLWRWARRGIRGVRLEVRRLGGRYVTSVESLDRFGQELAELEIPGAESKIPILRPNTRSERQRQRAIERAEAELRIAGI